MKNTEKRWFEVEGFYTAWFGFKVQATNEEEAKRLFWHSEVGLDEMTDQIDIMEVTNVIECQESSLPQDRTNDN